MLFSNRTIRIKAKTWKRDSHGLFDYEASNYNTQTFEINGPGKIMRTNYDVCYSNLLSSPDKQIDEEKPLDEPFELARILEDPHGIKIIPNERTQDPLRQVWITANRGDSSRGHQVKENDTIKIGRVFFIIKKVSLQDRQAPDTSAEQIVNAYVKKYTGKTPEIAEVPNCKPSDEQTGGVSCKICLGDQNDDLDPLINPCNCIGSVKYVHFKCLQNWVNSKIDPESNKKVLTLFWSSLHCELCKSKLPLYVNYKGKELLVSKFENQDMNSFMILESFNHEFQPLGIHVLNISSKQNFTIGRSQDADLKIKDISVSRFHAQIGVKKGKILLSDNYSKFGTLIQVKEPIILNDQNTSSSLLQCGKSVIKISIYKPLRMVIPCLGSLFSLCRSFDSKTERMSEENPKERLHTNF